MREMTGGAGRVRRSLRRSVARRGRIGSARGVFRVNREAPAVPLKIDVNEVADVARGALRDRVAGHRAGPRAAHRADARAALAVGVDRARSRAHVTDADPAGARRIAGPSERRAAHGDHVREVSAELARVGVTPAKIKAPADLSRGALGVERAARDAHARARVAGEAEPRGAGERRRAGAPGGGALVADAQRREGSESPHTAPEARWLGHGGAGCSLNDGVTPTGAEKKSDGAQTRRA